MGRGATGVFKHLLNGPLEAVSRETVYSLQLTAHSSQLTAHSLQLSGIKTMKHVAILLLYILTLIGPGCSGARPRHPNDLCDIFREKEKWYKHAYASYERWHVPIPVMMAIMRHESGFHPEARPPRTTCLFIFPGPRLSTAYGYPQALDQTWEMYKQATDRRGAERDDFADAIDFIGWYCDQSHMLCGISKSDPYNLYLAYHEGQGGFRRKTYQKKAWLKRVATNVRGRTKAYANQLASCELEFRKPQGKCLLW